MTYGGGTRGMGRVATCPAFASSVLVRTAAAVVVARLGRPGGLRREDLRRRRCQNRLRRLVLHP